MPVSFTRMDVIIADLGTAPARPSRVLIAWELVRTYNGLPEVTFVVERSQSPAFPENEVDQIDTVDGQAGLLVYSAADGTACLINVWRRYFYRVRAQSPGLPDVVSIAKTWETSPRLHELAIIEGHDFLLRYYTGTPAFAFIERTADAPPCRCFDRTTGRSTQSDCLLCLNTGKQRPFFDPIPLFVDFNPDQKITQITTFGESQPNAKACWFSAYPILKPADLLYEVGTTKLWRIATMEASQPQGTTLQQIATLTMVDFTNVEYRSLVQQIADDELLSIVQEWESIKGEREF